MATGKSPYRLFYEPAEEDDPMEGATLEELIESAAPVDVSESADEECDFPAWSTALDTDEDADSLTDVDAAPQSETCMSIDRYRPSAELSSNT